MMPKRICIDGMVFGRLTAVRRAPSDKHGNPRWLCKCQCGNSKELLVHNLRSGTTISCGCVLRHEASIRGQIYGAITGAANVTHGHARTAAHTRTYRSWRSMKQRCSVQTNKSYKNYGARGIRVCDRWMNSFEAFLEDMGERPPGNTLDRYPDNDGDYEPGNCRWATWEQQASNRRPPRRCKSAAMGKVIVEV